MLVFSPSPVAVVASAFILDRCSRHTPLALVVMVMMVLMVVLIVMVMMVVMVMVMTVM